MLGQLRGRFLRSVRGSGRKNRGLASQLGRHILERIVCRSHSSQEKRSDTFIILAKKKPLPLVMRTNAGSQKPISYFSGTFTTAMKLGGNIKLLSPVDMMPPPNASLL